MSVASSTGITRFRFSDRPRYGQPYPEGMAVGHGEITGDGSGGTISQTFLSDGGFLYRLELLNMTRGDGVAHVVDVITSHRWATDKAPVAAGSFALNWTMDETIGDGFSVSTTKLNDLFQIRRFPMGRLDNVPLQILLTMRDDTNTNAIVYNFDCVFSYWRKEALTFPGFLQAFWEAPDIGPLGRFL